MSDRWTVRLMISVALVLLVSRVAVVAVPNADDIVILPTPAPATTPTLTTVPTPSRSPAPTSSESPTPESPTPEPDSTATSSQMPEPFGTATPESTIPIPSLVISLPTLAPLPTLVPIPTLLPIPTPSLCIPTIPVAPHVPELVCGHNLNPKICC